MTEEERQARMTELTYRCADTQGRDTEAYLAACAELRCLEDDTRCCWTHHKHVDPHRGCILR